MVTVERPDAGADLPAEAQPPASEAVGETPDQAPAPKAPSEIAREAGYVWWIDHFALSPNALLFYGWCAHPERALTHVLLELRNGDGSIETLEVPYGHPRPDVARDHPGLPAACGFYLYTGLRQAACEATFQARTLDGETITLDHLHYVAPEPPPPPPPPETWRTRRDARIERFKDWAHRELSWTADPPPVGMDGEVADYTKRPLRDLILSIGRNTLLIIDHSLGGGANLYRQSLVAEARARGRTVIVWTFALQSLRHHLHIYRKNQPEQRAWVGFDAWKPLLASKQIRDVYFNNCVSFPEPEQVADMLLAFCGAPRTRVSLFVHDFHMVCPSNFLINDEGRFCGIPDRRQCHRCLPRSDQQMVNLYRSRDIDRWRTRWLACLQAADAIICFSENSKSLLLRAYPMLAHRHVEVRPHRVPPLPGRYRRPAASPTLRVGVVGSIGPHKGSGVVTALADRIAARELAAEIHVIGTLNAPHQSPLIHETGPYAHSELADLLNTRGVDMVLVPSICPETFSFVTHELISLGAPIVSFDLGAQGDAVRQYRRGLVVELGPTDQLLDHLLAFKARLDAQPD